MNINTTTACCHSSLSHVLLVLKICKDARMGIVTEVKQSLHRASALKIMYADVNVDRITFLQ